MKRRTRLAGGAICLFLSGAAALFYELIWSHQFSIVFGSSEIATASVLGIYLAGLGLGAALALRHCRTSRRPLRTYALLEAAIAFSALAVPWGLGLCQNVFYRSFATDQLPAASLGSSWLWQLAITVGLLATPTLCLGASFPYAIRGLVVASDPPNRTTAWLYGANTLGAVAGCLAAGILTVPALGIRASTWAGAGLSLTAALLALALPAGGAPRIDPAPELEPAPGRKFPFGPVVVIAGAVSLATQILWTRLLIHFVGSGLYALSILLAAFLLGLALGSLVAGAVAPLQRRQAVGFATAQLFVAGWSWIAFRGLDLWAGAGPPALASFDDRLLRSAAIAALTLLPIAAGSGAAFLFAIGARTTSADDAAPTVARAYAWTAIGNLVGGILLALVVFPRLGFGGAQELLVGLSLLAAAWALWAAPRRRLWPAIAALLLGLVLLPLPDARGVLTYSPLTGGSDPGNVVFAELGTSASVVLTAVEGGWSLHTNGLAEGSIQPRGAPSNRHVITRWLGVLPFVVRPQANDALVIGLGAGTTVESVPSTARRLAVIEIERQVVHANASLAAVRRRDVLAGPRLELVVNDARDALNRTRRRFDVIISQPSHPWTAGSANLYTREFFAAVRARLGPDGVFAQWLGLPFVDEPLLRSVLATLTAVFPYVEVFAPPPGGGLIFLAAERPMTLDLAPPLRDELVALGIARPEDLGAAWVLDARGARLAGSDAELISDDHNLLAARSPKVLGHGLARSRGREVLAAHDPLTGDLHGWNRLALVERLHDPERIDRIARAATDPAWRQLLLGSLPGATTPQSRKLLLSSALEIAPGDEVARAAILVLARPGLGQGGPPPAILRDLTAGESLLVAGWRAAAAQDWLALSTLDDELAALAPSSPLFWEAMMLRSQWRARATEAAELRQALALLNAILSHAPSGQALALYAFIADRAGLEMGALAALSDLSRLPASERSAAIDAAAQRLLRSGRFDDRFASWIAQIAARLSGREPSSAAMDAGASGR